MRKSKVYLDTSAYNFILLNYSIDELSHIICDKYEVCFSSCNLDEFGLCEPDISSRLATFAWQVSNKKKLLDHIDLIIHEMLFYLGKVKHLDYFDENDAGFFMAWEAMRDKTVPADFIEFTKEMAKEIKQGFKERARDMRKFFNPYLQDIDFDRTELVKLYWSKILSDMEKEGWIQNFFINNLYEYIPEFSEVISLDELLTIDYRKLTGTAPGIQYYFALQYVQCFQSGLLSKPDMGDQADVRHTFYAGIMDYFVSNDKRMIEIFNDYIFAECAIVIDPNDFINDYVRN